MPHTLKVNELPKHTHNIPGYWYGGEGSGYYLVGADQNNLFAIYNLNEKQKTIYFQLSENPDRTGPRLYRRFELGHGNGSPTTETGNNESLSFNLNKQIFF